MRGKKSTSATGRTKYSLEDPYSVLENSPGTPVFFKKKHYELIAKMENLGPFNLFFTLSCGEKRYNENFTTFLKDHNVTYEYKQGREEVFVDGDLMGHLMMDSKGWPYDSFDCLSCLLLLRVNKCLVGFW